MINSRYLSIDGQITRQILLENSVLLRDAFKTLEENPNEKNEFVLAMNDRLETIDYNLLALEKYIDRLIEKNNSQSKSGKSMDTRQIKHPHALK
jgi:hypothetical protein